MEQQKNRPVVRFRGFHEEWDNDILDNQVEFFTGLTYSPNDVSDKGTFVIRSSNIKENRLVKTDNVFVNSDVVNCEYVKKNDIVVVVRNGSRGLIGKHAQLKGDEFNTVIGAFMTGIRCDESNFITALLDTNQFKSEINKNLGATINQITTGNFKNMEFGFPKSKPEQTKIGSFFENLDQLLGKHQAQHQKLKALKKAMLGKLFPKQGATVPEIRFKGFTGDWEEKELKKEATIYRGLTYSPNDVCEKGIKVVRSSNIYEGEFIEKEDDIYVNEGAINIGYLIENDIVVTSANGSSELVGKHAVFHNIDSKSVHGGFMLKIRAKSPYFMNASMSTEWYKKFITRYTSGGGGSIGNLSKYDLEEQVVLMPSLKEQQQIANYFKNLDQLITKHATQIEKLATIKKACLSKMFV